MKKWTISKTAVLGWAMTIVGGLGLLGIDFPVDKIEELLGRITDDTLELYILLSGPIALWLRKVTTSPVAQGIWGWLGKKEKQS